MATKVPQTVLRSPLFVQFEAAQAQFTSYHGWEIASSFGSVEAEYWALKEACGLLDLSHRGRLLVEGRDAPRFLHGMVTNEVKEMKIGHGNYAFLLDVHGHILADARIFRVGAASYLVDSEPQLTEVIREALDRHIIADQVEVNDESSRMACLALEGPRAREVLREAIGFDPPHLHLWEHLLLEDHSVRLIRASLSGQEGYWILVGPEQAGTLWQRTLEVGTRLGLRAVGFEALEICRIEAGIPRYGVDMNEKTLPQETGQMHAISFTKGCYIGQEVVERIRSRGHVNRQLVGLLFEGQQEVPPQTGISADGQTVGTVTSSAYSFVLRRTIALGYLRLEYAEAGISVAAGTNPAKVAALPFVG